MQAHNTDAKNLDVAVIASLVRATIKAQTGRELPSGLRCSIRISRYSMGCSLSVTVTAVPFNTLNQERVAFERSQPHAVPIGYPRHSGAAERLLAQLERIVGTYHDDRSDLAQDVFNVNFAKSVSISGEVQRVDRSKLLEEVHG